MVLSSFRQVKTLETLAREDREVQQQELREYRQFWDGQAKPFEVVDLIIKKHIVDLIKSAIDTKYIVRGSTGMQSLNKRAEIPWVAIMDPLVTNTPKRGYYVVALLSADRKKVVLSIACGYMSESKIKTNITDHNALRLVKLKSTGLRSLLPEGILETYDDLKVKMGAKWPLGNAYEECIVCAREFSLFDEQGEALCLDEESFMASVQELLKAYEHIIRRKQKIASAKYNSSQANLFFTDSSKI
jgi:MrcB-like, N-terminal domain